MNVTWVNHASFIFEYDGIRLITDPWMEGTAFDNGWALLSNTVLQYEDFSTITHIWFSHEHPDHFSPPNLNKIPKAYREKITVLFQNTTDRKVADYCRKAGFGTVVEMETDKYYSLSANVQCKCNPFTDGDSWLYIKTDKYNLLNLNDCIICTPEDAKSIQAKTGPVDILFTQFGYANKVGNTDDVKEREEASAEKLRRIAIQQQVFAPKAIIPFASYVYFCHEENKYMNNGMNRVDRVYDFITDTLKTETVVLYPGDQWEALTAHDSTAAISKYLADYRKIDSNEVSYVAHPAKVEVKELATAAEKFTEKILQINQQVSFVKKYPTMKIWLTDYQQAFGFDFRKQLHQTGYTQDTCDISLSSNALLYSFKHLWGGDSLQINARFQTPANGNYYRARSFYELAAMANRGESSNNKAAFKHCLALSPYAGILKSIYRLVKK
ncbi:MBL fold metallo-hydrolase [Chitinophaga nivalis]|uniref:MBL fold metallo-hydrolase n=1 Tax=Chitinophaga nivalis TaxID=2991709 RepID=A0ABT3IJW2_9BACT|nr:MBL fold metallo-hydrolase [Chitinophaga nivalis]MCW3466059.1 MBL fold metallo-hydrolase [Chitinophaga nivalis]MCW3484250.1 MBL fold metallo-hydrolase [Chitinophaga nivalis]